MDPPFFAAKTRRQSKMIAPPDLEAGDARLEWFSELERTYDVWRVITGTEVYLWPFDDVRGPRLSNLNPSELTLEFVFPLSLKEGWYPSAWDREQEPQEDWLSGFRGVLQVVELETATDGTTLGSLSMFRHEDGDHREVTEQVEFKPKDPLDSCFLLGHANGGPPDWEWFCPGVGIVGGYYHHNGVAPFGIEYILIDYSFQPP